MWRTLLILKDVFLMKVFLFESCFTLLIDYLIAYRFNKNFPFRFVIYFVLSIANMILVVSIGHIILKFVTFFSFGILFYFFILFNLPLFLAVLLNMPKPLL